MLCLLRLFAKMRKLDKIMATADTWIRIVTAWAVKQPSYKTMGQSIGTLIVPKRVFCVGSSLRKYSYYPIIKYFAPIRQGDYNKSYELA